MAEVSTAVPIANGRPRADRTRDAARNLGCTIVWTRAIGPHVLLGLGDGEAFAQIDVGVGVTEAETNDVHGVRSAKGGAARR